MKKLLNLNRLSTFFIISALIIVLDQIVKMIIYFTFQEGEYVRVLGMDWFKIHYITNPGMAFGMQFGGEYGKIILSLFRIAAMVFIAIYMRKLFMQKAHKGLLICIAMIFGGAIGNIVDSTFYAFMDANELMVRNAPFKLFHGKVVDMFYFDIAEGYYADWIPLVGGDHYSFWPIFNIADASIFVAVVLIIIFQKQFFKEKEKEKVVSTSE